MTYEEDQLRRRLRAVTAERDALVYKARRIEEARARQPDWEKLWAEKTELLERAELVIETACEALGSNDEAGAYLILKNAVKELHEVHNAESLQGLPVQEEPKVPPET
jgi:DNA repair ATPase RecN